MKSFIAVVVNYVAAEPVISISNWNSTQTRKMAKQLIDTHPEEITSITISRISTERVMILEVLTPSPI